MKQKKEVSMSAKVDGLGAFSQKVEKLTEILKEAKTLTDEIASSTFTVTLSHEE